MSHPINPFLLRTQAQRPRVSDNTTSIPEYAQLPRAPINASPVPHLTSLYHFKTPGNYGDRSYPGNCGGNLIRDLLTFFQARNVFDPMTGSGTCADVCRELAIPCVSKDIRHGFDATDPESFRSLATSRFDFIWAHPPLLAAKALYRAIWRSLKDADPAILPETIWRIHPQLLESPCSLRQVGHTHG